MDEKSCLDCVFIYRNPYHDWFCERYPIKAKKLASGNETLGGVMCKIKNRNRDCKDWVKDPCLDCSFDHQAKTSCNKCQKDIRLKKEILNKVR